MNRRKTGWSVALRFMILGFLLLLFLLLNLTLGSTRLTLSELLSALRNPEQTGTADRIVWDLRIPRLASAALLGGALAVSGFLLQTFFGNPIAGPYVLGISSGAKLTVASAMILCLGRGIPLNSSGMVLAAFAGSLLVMAFILPAAGKVRQMSRLVVCGVMVGYICSAVTELLVTFAEDANIVNLHNWSMGSFSGISRENVFWIACITLPGILAAFLLSKPISAYQLGEAYAANLGVNLKRFRAALILLSSLLSACVTAFAGPVSFLGIAVPHLMKRFLNTSRPLLLIPACYLGGAVMALFCDLLARTLFSPTELSISTVTAVFGAPIVIHMLMTRRGGR